MPLKLFMVGIEPPLSKMSLVVVLAEVAIAVTGLVTVVNGRLRLAAAEVAVGCVSYDFRFKLKIS